MSGQPSAAGQIEFADAEDVARPVIGDDPAFGDARHDQAGRVQPHQTLRGGGAQMLGGERQAQPGRAHPLVRSDDRDIDHPIVPRRTAGGEHQAGDRRKQGVASERGAGV